jgi:ribonuclease P protein component
VNPPLRIKKRSDFIAARGGERFRSDLFVLESRMRDDADGHSLPARFGFTVTKKIGNAVTRNRIRRRLREAVRIHAGEAALAHHDYVIIAREGALSAPFGAIVAELARGLDRTGRFKANPKHFRKDRARRS